MYAHRTWFNLLLEEEEKKIRELRKRERVFSLQFLAGELPFPCMGSEKQASAFIYYLGWNGRVFSAKAIVSYSPLNLIKTARLPSEKWNYRLKLPSCPDLMLLISW